MKSRTYIILILASLLLLMTNSSVWNQGATVGKEEKEEVIPEQAIRLRILANSNNIQDQFLKRKVRDRIIQEIQRWKEKPTTIGEARQLIIQKMPTFKQISEKTVAEYGSNVPVQVDFGNVPFPTKLYGDRVYPAGNYEALRITLGKGEGDNWWCVLFPPLCFIDMSNGDAIQEETTPMVQSASLQPSIIKKKEKNPVQVRFFLLDKTREWLGQDSD